MVNREIVMDYILSCLQDLVENGVEIKPDSDLVNDLGLESIKVMDLLMMLEDRFDISIPINILLAGCQNPCAINGNSTSMAGE